MVDADEYHTPYTFDQDATSKDSCHRLSTHVDTAQLFFYPSTPIEVLVSTFQKMGVMRVFVTTQAGSLVGMVDRVQVSQLMLGALHQRQDEGAPPYFECLTRRRGVNQDEQFELEAT